MSILFSLQITNLSSLPVSNKVFRLNQNILLSSILCFAVWCTSKTLESDCVRKAQLIGFRIQSKLINFYLK